jgi:hypothetical protein
MQQGAGNQEVRPLAPPFNEETARQKVKSAHHVWNTRDPGKVALAYTEDSKWRKPRRVLRGARGHQGVLGVRMGQGTRLPAEEGDVMLHRQSHDESRQW